MAATQTFVASPVLDTGVQRLPLTRPTSSMLITGLVLAFTYALLEPGTGPELLRVAAPLVGALAITIGVVIHRPPQKAGWIVLTLSLVLASAHAAAWGLWYFDDHASVPPSIEALRILIAAGLLIAVIVMNAEAPSDRELYGPSETAIVAAATLLVFWLVVVERYLTRTDVGVSEVVWAIVVPLVGCASFVLAVGVAARDRFRHHWSLLLVSGVGMWTLGDMVRSSTTISDEFAPGTVAAAFPIFAAFALGAVALEPTMSLDKRPTAATAEVGRIIGLSIAALMPLGILLALMAFDVGTQTTRIVAIVASFVVVVLSLMRMWGLVGTVRSLTERRGQDRLAAMVEHSSDVVVLVDDVGHIRYASPGLRSTLGHRADDWISRPVLDLVASDDRASAIAQLHKVVAKGHGGTVTFEAMLIRVDGEPRAMEATIANLIGGDAVDGIVATFRDVTDQRDLENQLSHRAFHDELTGLANRALFLDRMDHALQVLRPGSDDVIVLFVDLDDFKSVNDALGHSIGDDLLVHISRQILATVAKGDTPARLGGDEFAVLLEGPGGIERALDVAGRLLERLEIPVSLGGYDLTVLASVGVAIASPDMTTSTLLRDADVAMYEAKRAGKGQIKIFDPAMRLSATKHLEYRSELANAIENERLRLVFQPQVDLETGDVIGAEALVRWRHPEHGEISPNEFIPIAEHSGLITSIGHWVLEESVRQATRWQRSGPREVSVNVSAVQLRNEDFIAHVARTLEAHSLDPRRLTLEITETALVNEIEAASSALGDLRSLGVKIAIDDFGTGYCSLSYLQRFPVDIVKIDKKFIEELGEDVKSSSLARMILQMTSSLDIVSVAEGIERLEQVNELRRLGCDVGQGYLLSKPLEADAIITRLGLTAPGPEGRVIALRPRREASQRAETAR